MHRPSDVKPAAPPRPPPPSNTTPLRPRRSVKPKSKKNVIEWFRQEELAKRICYDGDQILPYFHGENRSFGMCKYLKQVTIDCVGVCNYYRWAEQLQLLYTLLFFNILFV